MRSNMARFVQMTCEKDVHLIHYTITHGELCSGVKNGNGPENVRQATWFRGMAMNRRFGDWHVVLPLRRYCRTAYLHYGSDHILLVLESVA